MHSDFSLNRAFVQYQVVLGVQFSLRAGLQRVEITPGLAVLIFPKELVVTSYEGFKFKSLTGIEINALWLVRRYRVGLESTFGRE